MSFYKRFGKRAFDIVGSSAGLILLSPIYAATAAVVRLKLGSPVIFKHSRPGKNVVHFKLYKFRTMTDDRDGKGALLPDKQRITPVGAWLRTTSLDELPELVNILKGDMSLIGPRPLLTRYLPYYSESERQRFDVRPGLTGWAQVHGRNAVSWDDRLAKDVWYVQNVSFKLDLQILLSTINMVLKRQGIEVVPNAAMKSLDEERAQIA